MILIADSDRNLRDEINLLSRDNPFGCRIAALYSTYDYSLPFVDFWVQFIGGEPVSLVSRLETVFILRLTEKSDMDEISAFMRVSGADSVICDGAYVLDCGMKAETGPILACSSHQSLDDDCKIVVPTAKQVYSIISQCQSEHFSVPPYESFMLDVNHKLLKKTVRTYAVDADGPAACIMTLAESADCAVLGALATVPEHRREGYGSYLIKYINNILVDEGKRVFLHRAPDSNIEFYNQLGFELYGIWSEYR